MSLTIDVDPVILRRIARKANDLHAAGVGTYLDVLNLLSDQGDLTITRLSEELIIGRGTARRMLETLVQLRAVRVETRQRGNRYILNDDDLDVLFG